MSILDEICEHKRRHIAQRKLHRTIKDLEYMVQDLPLTYGFLSNLIMAKGPSLISEVKKASPSKGVIRSDFDHIKIAKLYEQAGAHCLSVLTDEPYFQGHDNYLVDIKENVDLPVLRKDFMIDLYQIYESRTLGADCILLIVAALSDHQIWEFYDCAVQLGMDVLVEVHDLEELERVIPLEPMMIGVNNRNLKTLDVDLKTSYDLLPHMPKSSYLISESGINTHEDVSKLHKCGYQGFLVGESLMRQDDIISAVHNLMNIQ
ncbi:MAG: indole-3-glycerol phosphate synthase TrpC [Alphaproteobacteria bacterium]|nr:indole-3-glycerol phosphate synthase TrpC [Alphaproteobacteria bacterium]